MLHDRAHRWLFAIAATSALFLITGGCRPSSGIQRVVVRGSVTLGGSPVEEGQIRFVPIEGTAGPVTIARIAGGKYVADDRGGVPIGKIRVEISAWDPKLPPGGRGEPTRPDLVPGKFNEKSELVETFAAESGTIEKNYNL